MHAEYSQCFGIVEKVRVRHTADDYTINRIWTFYFLLKGKHFAWNKVNFIKFQAAKNPPKCIFFRIVFPSKYSDVMGIY